MSKRKLDAKAFAQQKRNRRRFVTFVRMCRYGVNNFSRNAWLTIAATAVMTITLLIVFSTLAARNVLVDTVAQISSKVDMSIYLKTETSDKQANEVKSGIENLSSVKSVRYVSASEARSENAANNKGNDAILNAINEATNKNPAIMRIALVDINDTSELDSYVKNDKSLQPHLDPDRPPSFSGSRREAIKNIAQWVGFAEKIGIGATILFVTISSLIVFNTIRMAIFNRKEEIQMMKLIGADRNFIRGPFLVEASVYGFIAAVLATGAGVALLYAIKEPLMRNQIAIESTVQMATVYVGFVLIGMIILGALIGVISSLLATHRYLKI
ncbi:MAG: permease-like cell division protein FtsX [Candidatus Saccharimonadales bacterium]